MCLYVCRSRLSKVAVLRWYVVAVQSKGRCCCRREVSMPAPVEPGGKALTWRRCPRRCQVVDGSTGAERDVGSDWRRTSIDPCWHTRSCVVHPTNRQYAHNKQVNPIVLRGLWGNKTTTTTVTQTGSLFAYLLAHKVAAITPTENAQVLDERACVLEGHAHRCAVLACNDTYDRRRIRS